MTQRNGSIHESCKSIGIPLRIRRNPLEFHSESGGIHWNSIQNLAESIGIPFRIRQNPLEFHSESGGIHWNSIQNPAESIGIPFRIWWNPLEFHSESSRIHWNMRFLPFRRILDGIPTFHGSPPESAGTHVGG